MTADQTIRAAAVQAESLRVDAMNALTFGDAERAKELLRQQGQVLRKALSEAAG